MERKHAQPRAVGRTCLALQGLLMLAAGGCGPGDFDPRVALEEMHSALLQVESVRYRFEYFDGSSSGKPAQQGVVALRRLDLSGSAYMADWAIEDLRADETRRLTGQRTSNRVIAYDSERQKATWSWIVTASHSVQGSAGDAFMYPFFDPRSVRSEIEAESVTFEGRGQALGQPCDWIHVGYADDDEDSRWCLGVDDRLPRALEWISDGEVTSSLQVGDIEPEPTDAFVERPIPVEWSTREVRSGPPAGSIASEWTLGRPDGAKLSLGDLRGEVIVLDFWASWCPPCLAELPALEELLLDYGDKPIRAFAVNVMESLDVSAVEGFLRDRGVDLDILLAGESVLDEYAPGNLPALTVIDASGRNVGTMTGYYKGLSEDHVKRLIDVALSGPTGP